MHSCVNFFNSAHSGDTNKIALLLAEEPTLVNCVDTRKTDYGKLKPYNEHAYPQKGSVALHYAAVKGYTDTVHFLVNAGAKVDGQNEDGRTALMSAVLNGHMDIAEFLFQAGSSVNPLIWEAMKGGVETSGALLRAGSSVDSTDSMGWTALIWAADQGQEGIVKILLSSGANVDAQGGKGWSSLMRAAHNGHKDVAEILLRAGAKLDAQTLNGWNSLMRAACSGHKDVLEMLLLAGAKVDEQNTEGWTALMWAAFSGHTDIVKVLLTKGAKIDAQNHGGWTALMWAAVHGHKDTVEFLLISGAKVNTHNSEGWAALSAAASKGNSNIVEVLLCAGADINAQNKCGITALMEAAYHGHVNTTNILLRAGANVDVKNVRGLNALKMAVLQGQDFIAQIIRETTDSPSQRHSEWQMSQFLAAKAELTQTQQYLKKMELDHKCEMAKLKASQEYMEAEVSKVNERIDVLCQKITGSRAGIADVVAFMIDTCGADVENFDENGVTTLMLASRHGLQEIVSVLSTRCDSNAKTNEGVTALIEAAANNCLEVAQSLLSARADINSMTNDKMNALMVASLSGHTEIVSFLLHQNAAVNARNQAGDTALTLAVKHEHLKTIEVLLQHGAAVSIQNSQGLTPLLISAKNNFVAAAALLLGFDPESQLEVKGENGETPLLLASKAGSEEMVSFLLQRGANGWARTHQGFTAKLIANHFGHLAIADMLAGWEQNTPLQTEVIWDDSGKAYNIQNFLQSANLTHLVDFFVENIEMESVCEFTSLSQRRRNRIEKQLPSSDLDVLNSSLEKIGMVVQKFVSCSPNGEENTGNK